MKTLVIYYSLDGNCGRIADLLKSSLRAEVLEIKPKKNKKRKGFAKYFFGGAQVVFKRKPALMPYTVNPNDWDLIILGTPVWAASPSPAMASFLAGAKITGKKIALYCCHAGGMKKAMEKFKALLPGNTFAGEIDFINPAKTDGAELKQKVDDWVKKINL